MIIKCDKTGSVENFEKLLSEVDSDAVVKSILVVACDANGFTPAAIDGILKGVGKPIFGGVFPEIVCGMEKLKKGTIIAGLSSEADVKVLSGLSDEAKDFDGMVEELFPAQINSRTMFVLVDGYSSRISALIEALFNVIGLGLNYIGGGAGSINPDALDMTNRPCMITNGGMVKDSAILALTDMRSGVGVRHGWHKISGPYKVTETEGNALKSIDWKPAFDVYGEIVKEHCGKTITPENFFSIAKDYPMGMGNLSNSEWIVRDPFTVNEDNSIVLATAVPQESFIDILTGDKKSIVKAAGEAFKSASEFYDGPEDGKAILLIDCISRVMFLGDDFKDEIAAVSEEGVPLVGFLSLGEIANNGKEYLELFNKTCVVGLVAD